MAETKSISIMVTIPKELRDKLKRIVAEKTLQDLDTNSSVSSVCREIIGEYIEQREKEYSI